MPTNRRKFISTALAGGLAAATLPASSYGHASHRDEVPGQGTAPLKDTYAKLDAILEKPVFKKEFFPDPVIIQSVELLRYQDNFLCRVRSTNGAVGISVGHSGQLKSLFPISVNLLHPFFINKDARELDLIMEKVFIYKLNFRLNGMALGVPLATIEFAILDMMGRIANKTIGQLIGDIHHSDVEVYQATEYREKSVEESMELITRDVEEYNAKALKIKIGGLMFMFEDMYRKGPPGRTEKMIPLVRKTFGDKMVLYADSNGFYSVEEAIRVGKLLEQYKFDFFEEPVCFDWREETKQVADGLSIPIALGEQEYSLHGFRWLIGNKAVKIVQPDTFYFGGMIRSMKVARMADTMGIKCTPHMTGGDLGFLYMMHFVSALPNALEHHEFKGFKTNVSYECKTSPLKSVNGVVKVPTGPGSGVEIDPDYIKKHQVVKV
ncbi:MAG TPA: mandelate racemase/muconate lactonizing enzyme family protein [Chitinophagaceae bacterium]|jgi:L-alanine-DL-glutamate epimerase-like enolase superfamily enzyme|nr:mandelate racemase/muconate lactonizing enzyme family protein [Chitinophagaceae bacterium]